MKPEVFKKFNIAVWIPNLDYKKILDKPLQYSSHAKKYKNNHDYKHDLDYKDITREQLVNSIVVEVYTTPIVLENESVEFVFKVVCRIKRSNQKDIVAVVGLGKYSNKIITAWLNSSTDNHSTLKMKDIHPKIQAKFAYYQ